jgi:UDP-2,4-diacetamido-2,4,6-trideoxy-beta-L-altropyranose hydrolase
VKKIIFRADGNSATGLGHLYRVFALIEMYRGHFDCTLATRVDSYTGIIPRDYDFVTFDVPASAEAEWLSARYKPSDTIVVCDGYQFDTAYQRSIKARGYYLVYVDDLVEYEMLADIVINHAVSVKAAEYKAAHYTQFALGPVFAMLRPGFLEAAGKPRSIQKIERCFVCFGGADPSDITTKAVRALISFKAIREVNVVLGAAYVHEEVNQIGDPRVKIYRQIGEDALVELLGRSDFAVVPASNILYEVCAVKMPVLSGYYVQNQKRIWRGCAEKGLIFDGGDLGKYTESDFREKIAGILNDEGKYRKQIEVQAKFFDGHIKTRFLSLLAEIGYRRAGEQDLMQVFRWANDELSRRNSYQSEPIEFTTHRSWFTNKLKDECATLYIAVIDNKDAGLIRYEIKDDHAIVGIMLDEAFRGAGLASRVLKDTAALFFSVSRVPILAYIKKSNVASVRSFEKAGYQWLRDEVVHGADSYVYKLEKEDVQGK